MDLRSIELRGLAMLPFAADDVGGLVGGLRDDNPRILAGIVMGPARLQVERREHPPGDTVSGWEDAVEVSCRAVATVALAAGPWDESPGDECAINPPGSGWFRLRVHARHRDLEYDLVASGPHEEYLLVSWPAEPADPKVLAAGSALAQRYVAAQERAPGAAATRPGAVARSAGFSESPADAARRAQAEANLRRQAGGRPGS